MTNEQLAHELTLLRTSYVLKGDVDPLSVESDDQIRFIDEYLLYYDKALEYLNRRRP